MLERDFGFRMFNFGFFILSLRGVNLRSSDRRGNLMLYRAVMQVFCFSFQLYASGF